MTTLAFFAIANGASAQEYYAHKHYAHTHYAHARYHHYEGRHIVVHAQEPAPAPVQSYAWGPTAAVGNVVVGTGQAVQGVFTGAGAIVGGVLGGVVGGAAALVGAPYTATPSYAFGAFTSSYLAYGWATSSYLHTGPLSPRRSMRPGQWPHHRSKRWAALSEGRRPPAAATERTMWLSEIRGRID